MLGGQVGPLVLLPLGIFVFNGLILAALWGWKKPWRPAFYILGAVDILVALGIGLSFLPSLNDPSGFGGLLLLLCGAFALKGVLTILYAKKV